MKIDRRPAVILAVDQGENSKPRGMQMHKRKMILTPIRDSLGLATSISMSLCHRWYVEQLCIVALWKFHVELDLE